MAQRNRANLAKLLHILFTNRPLLFLGCSLDKDKTLEVLGRIHADLPGLTHYGVLAAPYHLRSLTERRLQLASYGIFPLWYVPGHFSRIRTLLEEFDPGGIDASDLETARYDGGGSPGGAGSDARYS